MNLKGNHRIRQSIGALTAVFSGDWWPDVIQGWMYHGNLCAWMLSSVIPRTALAWNIRQTLYDLKSEKPGSRMVIRANAALSRAADLIVCNSELSIGQHQAFGFSSKKWCLIPNGFDLNHFKGDANARRILRCSLGVPDDAFLVGQIARVAKMKDHLNAIKAVAMAAKMVPGLRLLFAGKGATMANQELVSDLEQHGILDRTSLLGETQDTSAIYPALDGLVSASAFGEGFPNVIGEALACEVPCVATRVGDTALAMGGHGFLVQPRAPEALATGILELYGLGAGGRASLGASGRAYIERHFSIGTIAMAYDACYREIRGG
jgi:glycosyltransferase involved in cell wall biosynthesis